MLTWQSYALAFGRTSGAVNIGYITADATKKVASGLVNLMYAVNPKLDVGVEGLYATREIGGSAAGHMSRLHFTARYKF